MEQVEQSPALKFPGFAPMKVTAQEVAVVEVLVKVTPATVGMDLLEMLANIIVIEIINYMSYLYCHNIFKISKPNY